MRITSWVVPHSYFLFVSRLCLFMWRVFCAGGGGGVLRTSCVSLVCMDLTRPKQAGPGVRVIMMDKAAHHLDLFFEHPLDPQEVSLARREEMDLVEKWVEEAYLVDASTFTESEGDGDDVVSHPDGEIRGVSAASSGEQKRSSPLLSWLDRFPALVADW